MIFVYTCFDSPDIMHHYLRLLRGYQQPFTNIKRLLFGITIFTVLPSRLIAQQGEIDSLNQLLNGLSAQTGFAKDTHYLNNLNELAFAYGRINPDSSIILSNLSNDLCEEAPHLTGSVEALKNLGNAWYIKGEYPKALSYYEGALKLAQKIDYKLGIGRLHNNIALIYNVQGRYALAIEQYRESLRIREEIGDQYGLASTFNNLAVIYFDQANYGDAEKNYRRSLEISEAINDETGIVTALVNLGDVYFKTGRIDESLDVLLQSKGKAAHIGNREILATIANQTGAVYASKMEFQLAILQYDTALLQSVDMGLKEVECRSYLGLAEVYSQMGNNEKALANAIKANDISVEIGFTELVRNSSKLLSEIFEARGNFELSLIHFKQFKLASDSLLNLENERASASLIASHEYAEKELVFQKKATQQRWLIFSALAALASMVVIAWVINRSRKRVRQTNEKLVEQNEEIETQKKELQEALNTLKVTQAQLIHAEKLASMGELTAGIAHEIQNPLNFVNNFAELGVELIDEVQQEIRSGNMEELPEIILLLRTNLEKITQHGKRADSIVKGMLQHSNKSAGLKEATNINTLLKEYLKLTYQGFRARDNTFAAKIETDFDGSIDKINLIPQDIGRVIVNLLNNAFYTVAEKARQQGEEYMPTVVLRTTKNGDMIIICVTDNGNGIPEKELDKIFQPFFTTKPTGQGTGLGLSLSYDIITKGHGGILSAESVEGQGTTFTITLPSK